MAFWSAVATFFKSIGTAWKAASTLQKINYVLTAVTAVVGVKGYLQARQMLAKGQDILANKTSAGGKIPVIYGTRRVGAQVIYMDVSNNNSKHLFVVYALSVGECDEILGRTIELDGNPITDPKRFRYGCYVGSDRNGETGYSGHRALNTVTQIGSTISAGAGGFGTSSTSRYRITFNLHHGEPTQSADPMLVASMPNWTSSHKLNGICYIAAHYKYDKAGMFAGVPQLTVQVKGKRVFDPRDNSQTLGTPSTYKHSSNPALCFLDLITNNEYGKGLTASQLNMSTFSSAANVCDTQVDQPYFNGSAQSVTWSASSGDNFFTITGTGANDVWWQNKVDEVISIYDQNGDGVLTDKEITDIQRTNFFDTTQEFIIFINAYFSSDYSSVNGTTLLKVKRFHCNGYIDTNKNVMDNAKELLANMRGIFLYVDGKYELQIEDTGTSTFTITDNHIISDAGISVDYGNKDKKANKVIVEFFNANKKYELDTATVLHDASPQYYSDDGDEVLEIKAEFPYITDPYIAYNMAKAILTRSRNQTTMQFLGTPEMYKLNVGDIVTLAYTPLGFTGKISRVEALELQPDGLVAVSLIEYFDVYTWEVPPQEPVEEQSNPPSAYAVKPPTGLTFTDSDSSSTGRPILSWTAPTDYPDYEFRVNVVDSSGNQLMNRIVNTTEAELNFTPTGNNYVASITSLNTLGTESDATTLTFNLTTEPVAEGDIRANAITANKIDVIELSAISADLGSIDAGSMNIGSGNFTVSTAGVMTATGATISGQISATTGAIGGFTVGSTSLTAGSDSSRISLSTTDGIHLGHNTFASAPFRVALDGSVTATNATITGALTLTNIDGTTVTYTGGQLGVGTISGGNLGDSAVFPATLRYERSDATTAPTDSEFNTAFGRDPKENDIVVVVRTDTNAQVAYKHDGTSFSVITNYIDGELIVDGTITANQLAANSVEANQINVGTLSAISANMGAITAGTINNTTNTPTAGQEPTGSQAGTAIDLASGAFTFGNVNAFLYFNTTDGLVQGGLTPFRDTVSIYYQGSTAPSSPSDSSMTYTSTGAFSFTTNPPTGWTLSIPNTTDNIYVVQANIGRTGAGTTTASWGAVSLLRAATVTGTSLATSPATIAFSYASPSSTSPESYSNSYTVTASGAYSHSVGITATVASGTWTSLGASSITVSEVSGDTGEFTISSITHQSNFEEKTWSWTVTHTSSGSTVSQSTLSINPTLQ